MLAAVLAGAAVNVDPRHYRLDLRQIDMIVGVHVRLIAGRGGFSAFRASIRENVAHMVGVLSQLARNAGAAFAQFLRLLGLVCFLAFRRRQR